LLFVLTQNLLLLRLLLLFVGFLRGRCGLFYADKAVAVVVVVVVAVAASCFCSPRRGAALLAAVPVAAARKTN
jgi:hypothetical protein